MPNDARADDEIKAIIHQWRTAHRAVTKFWKDLARAIRVAIRIGEPVLVAPAPQPPIVATFDRRHPPAEAAERPSDRLSGSAARSEPVRRRSARRRILRQRAAVNGGPVRGWFGVFVENVVQGVARDLLAAAIDRFEARGLNVVFHCHDEVTIETPIGALSDRRLPRHPARSAGLGRWLAARRQGP